MYRRGARVDTALAADEVYAGANPAHDFQKTMVEHIPPSEPENNEANFYPVDGMRGHCKCGNYFHYISREGDIDCEECGRTLNVYVDHEVWDE